MLSIFWLSNPGWMPLKPNGGTQVVLVAHAYAVRFLIDIIRCNYIGVYDAAQPIEARLLAPPDSAPPFLPSTKISILRFSSTPSTSRPRLQCSFAYTTMAAYNAGLGWGRVVIMLWGCDQRMHFNADKFSMGVRLSHNSVLRYVLIQRVRQPTFPHWLWITVLSQLYVGLRCRSELIM